ncbi:MAG TPA: hypothetical protein VFW07_24875 [Parafilimonas sp.]|nr:hypothetical protein [Parafilimonas sp.]
MMGPKWNSLLLCLLLVCFTARAQQFKEKASLQPITATGFYSINISPRLSSYVAVDYRDLRIADNNNKFIPYLIISKQSSFPEQQYNKLPIVKNELSDNGRSVLIIKNEERIKISSLALLIRNAAVNRNATISGSDDSVHWFTITENINLKREAVAEADRYVQTVDFPISSYTFLKIVIDNRRNNPLNVMEAGSFMNDGQMETNSYVINPSPSFIQTDSSDNNTYLSVHQNAAYHVNRITLQIKTPGFYERNVDIINTSGIAGFTIRSGNISNFDLPTFNDTSWLIKIYNGDNPSLKINSIKLEQETQKMIAYLQAGSKYHLLMHDPAAIKPVYDLELFKDSVPKTLPQLEIASFEKIDNKSSVAENKFFISSAWLWPLIIVVLATLGFITYRLTKEMSKGTG